MNASGFFRAAKAAGINVDGVVMSGGELCFTDVPQERQDALRALLASYDPSKDDHNEQIDRQIADVERANPISHRASREGHYALALIADAINDIVGQIEAEIRTVPGHSSFMLPRVPDLKSNAGMVRIKTADDAIKVLRGQRLP